MKKILRNSLNSKLIFHIYRWSIEKYKYQNEFPSYPWIQIASWIPIEDSLLPIEEIWWLDPPFSFRIDWHGFPNPIFLDENQKIHHSFSISIAIEFEIRLIHIIIWFFNVIGIKMEWSRIIRNFSIEVHYLSSHWFSFIFLPIVFSFLSQISSSKSSLISDTNIVCKS